ncbi:MAG: hypothetical protein PHI97_32525 [Desulfobulbus sp.]|nr:hypothetical protein [Desulfobulbus sp.]
MIRLHTLATLLLSITFLFGTSAYGKESDETDKVTLTINATCVANAVLNEQDVSLKDKVTVTLSERAIYRIVSSEGGRLELELVDHKNVIKISGGGTWKDPLESRSWTYNADNPTPGNNQSSVSVDTSQGIGTIHLLNFVQGGKLKASTEDVQQTAPTIADMALSFATSTLGSGGSIASNEEFLKGLNFTFDPQSKHFATGGNANYHFTLPGEKGAETGSVSVNYTVISGVPKELYAVLIPKGDYFKWLPAAAGKGPDILGNAITFAVELRNPECGKAKEKTAQFEIELLETSRYPGATMNSPWTDVAPDLKILNTNNPTLLEISANGQKAKTTTGLRSSNITISSFDGAAMGRLSVLARIDGEDTVLTAHLENEKELTEVSIPYDSNGNTIADAWEQQNGVLGKAIETDEDATPQGDGHNGDGLTVWEKYRGFLEDGTHIRTNPRKKDFFICDTIGGRSKRGINRFSALTKLDVHDKLTLKELSPSRVINRNRSEDGPHVVNQHGVLLMTFTRTNEDYAGMAVGGPGTPKSVDRVILDSKLSDTSTRKFEDGTIKTYEYFAPIVAHELLHCCNVWHHGQRDTIVYWKAEKVTKAEKATDYVVGTNIYEYEKLADCGHPEKGRLKNIYNENNVLYDTNHPFWASPRLIYLGAQQGQHSGVEDCVMRYAVSNAYEDGGGRRNYVTESMGQKLCVLPTGTGVNKKDRSPRSRYGDADEGRGACANQICVNDLYH